MWEIRPTTPETDQLEKNWMVQNSRHRQSFSVFFWAPSRVIKC